MNYDEPVGRLTALSEAPDLDLLDRTVEPLEQAMRTDDPQGYAWFVIAVCDQLNSRDLGDWRRQDELVGKYARLGLRHATVLPPAPELRLLEHVVAVPAQERRGVARRWLSVLGRLEREIDPTFDPADVPLLNVPVPGDGLPPGVGEEHVQNPALRQRYAQAVSENRAHGERYAGRLRCASCCRGIGRLRSGSGRPTGAMARITVWASVTACNRWRAAGRAGRPRHDRSPLRGGSVRRQRPRCRDHAESPR